MSSSERTAEPSRCQPQASAKLSSEGVSRDLSSSRACHSGRRKPKPHRGVASLLLGYDGKLPGGILGLRLECTQDPLLQLPGPKAKASPEKAKAKAAGDETSRRKCQPRPQRIGFMLVS